MNLDRNGGPFGVHLGVGAAGIEDRPDVRERRIAATVLVERDLASHLTRVAGGIQDGNAVPTESLGTSTPPKLREIADLPGPRGLPLIGNMLQIDKPHIHRQVERWAAEYGPYFRFRLGPRSLSFRSAG